MSMSRREFTQLSLSAATVLAMGNASGQTASTNVIKRTIPSSGEAIPILGLGAMSYRLRPDATEAEKSPLKAALLRFLELGGTFVDTAPIYGNSEVVLGELITDLAIRKQLFLATKTNMPTRSASETQVRQSLDNLQTDRIDLIQVHSLYGWQESLPLLFELKQEGKLRYVGITTSRAADYKEMEQVMRSHELDFIQANYSLGERESARRLLPMSADLGIGVIVNRPFGGGRLFSAIGDRPLPDWAANFGCSSWAQFMLKYSLSHPATTQAITGMTKAHHIDDNFKAARGRMPDARERKRMEDAFDAL